MLRFKLKVAWLASFEGSSEDIIHVSAPVLSKYHSSMTAFDEDITDTTRLSDHIRVLMDIYFENLNGEQPCGVYQMVLAEMEKPLLESVMEYADNNQSKASKILGINRNTLRKKLETYHL